LLKQVVDSHWPEEIFQRSFERYRRLTGGYADTSFWFEIQ
jgi:hypothetical protein